MERVARLDRGAESWTRRVRSGEPTIKFFMPPYVARIPPADLAFRVSEDPGETIDRLQRLGVAVVEGPVRRFGPGGWGHSVYCHDPSGNGVELISYDVHRAPRREAEHPDLQPLDERTALTQRLEQYRETVATALRGRTWEEASSLSLLATDLTIAGIVRHLAWAEDRWFQGRLRHDTPATSTCSATRSTNRAPRA
ncbi:MAG: DUF664 domain-containing protein [Actinomycetota bacterium]